MFVSVNINIYRQFCGLDNLLSIVTYEFLLEFKKEIVFHLELSLLLRFYSIIFIFGLVGYRKNIPLTSLRVLIDEELSRLINCSEFATVEGTPKLIYKDSNINFNKDTVITSTVILLVIRASEIYRYLVSIC